jgi:heptosyltransferase-2
MKEFKNILVRATNWVGDAVMSLPALQQLRATHPRARISILARPWVGALYGRETFCDELIPYEAERGWRDLDAKRRLAADLQSRNFDCALLLQNAFEAALLVWWARIPERIGYNRDARRWLLTRAVAVPQRNAIPKHQRFYYLELLKRAGLINSYDLGIPIQLSGARAAAAQGRLRLDQLVGSRHVVGVSPGAAFGGAKRWLPERFAAAAVSVAKARNAVVVVMGSTAESDICTLVQKHISAEGVECRSLAGSTDLAEFIAITAACEIMLTNDSGAMHISSALGVPTVAVFGATDAAATGPTGALARVIQEHVECSPCGLRECPIDHRCMTRLSADRVAETALELVDAVKLPR